MPAPKVRFLVPDAPGRKNSVFLLVRAVENETRKISTSGEAFRKASSIPAVAQRKASTQVFLDKIFSLSATIRSLERHMNDFKNYYARNIFIRPDTILEEVEEEQPGRSTEPYDVLLKHLDHHCGDVRHQIEAFKHQVREAGKSGILAMDKEMRNVQYSLFVKQLVVLMDEYERVKTEFVKWWAETESVEKARSLATELASPLPDQTFDNASNNIETRLADMKLLVENLKEISDLLEDFAWLVEGQADLIERIDEIEEAAPTSPVEDGLSELLGQAGPAETPDEWKTDIKNLALFGIVGLLSFVLLSAFILSRGRMCYGDDDPNSIYSCKKLPLMQTNTTLSHLH